MPDLSGEKLVNPCRGSIRFGGLPLQRCWYRLQAAALSLLMLALSIDVSLAQATLNPKPRDHVYLLRGFANVFSLGMDQIATRLQHQGIDTRLVGLGRRRSRSRSPASPCTAC